MRYLAVFLLLLSLTIYLFADLGEKKCVDFLLLGYSGRGETVSAKLCKVPYPGIYVSPEVVGTRLAESAKVAFYTFNRRHGPVEYGFILSVGGPVEFVEGRSADIAIYSAIVSLVNGRKPPLATGKIANDGFTIEGVAYVREKVSAVGRGPIIMPYANREDIPSDAFVIPVKNLDELDAVLSSLPS